MEKPVYRTPEVLTHQPIRFETTQSGPPKEDNPNPGPILEAK
jgi:hypothetical protein